MAQIDPKLKELLEKGQSALRNEYFDLAEDFLSQALARVPHNEEILQLLDLAKAGRGRKLYKNPVSRFITGWLCMVKLLLGKFEAAAPTLDYLHKGFPDKFMYAYGYGRCCYKLERPRDGVAALEKAIAARPKHIPTLQMLSELYRSTKQFDEAIQMTERLRLYNPGDHKLEKVLKDISALAYAERDAQIKLKEARAEVEKQRVETEDPAVRAEKLIARCQEEPENTELRVELARALRQADQTQAACQVLDELLAKRPEDASALRELVQCRYASRDWAAAEEVAARLLSLLPDDHDAKSFFATAKLRRLEDAYKADPANPAVKAALREYQKEVAAEEIERLRQESRVNPGPDVSLALGRALLRHDEPDAAIAELQKAAAAPQFSFLGHKAMGEAYQHKRMFDLALDQYRIALSKAKSYTGAMPRDIKEIYYAMGECHYMLGNLVEAEKAYKELYAADINYLDIRQRYEKTYTELKQRERSA
ncbi:tetratricopeptide repeat protein [bacterium]|nr:tetratricopeptide repeat protein [bacterium]